MRSFIGRVGLTMYLWAVGHHRIYGRRVPKQRVMNGALVYMKLWCQAHGVDFRAAVRHADSRVLDKN